MSDPEADQEELAALGEDGDNFLEHGQIDTNHYFKFSNLSDWRNSIAIAVAADIAARSSVAATWAGVGAAVTAEVLARVRKLEPDEVVALYVLKSLAGGGSMYEVWVEEGELVARLADEHVEDDGYLRTRLDACSLA